MATNPVTPVLPPRAPQQANDPNHDGAPSGAASQRESGLFSLPARQNDHNGTQSQVAGAWVGSLFPNISPTKKLTLKEHPNLLTELGKNKKVDVALKPIREILESQHTASVQSITLLDWVMIARTTDVAKDKSRAPG
jgi:hypothetical protein